MKKQQGNALVLFVLALVAVVAAGYGYVMNLVKLFHIPSVDGHIGEVVIRIIGVFTGVVGVVAGYF